MPIYEYICAECQTRFDAMRPMSQADAPIACVSCGSLKTSRAISLFSAISGGRVVAGSSQSCGSCSSSSCAGCGSRH